MSCSVWGGSCGGRVVEGRATEALRPLRVRVAVVMETIGEDKARVGR